MPFLSNQRLLRSYILKLFHRIEDGILCTKQLFYTNTSHNLAINYTFFCYLLDFIDFDYLAILKNRT